MIRVRDTSTFATGVFLVLVAIGALIVAWPLRSTSSVGLGPGYVPKMFAVILLILGCVIAVAGIRLEGEPTERWRLRPLTLVLASIGFFAFAVERLGMAVALIGLVLISSAAHEQVKWRDALLLAGVAVLFAWLIFQKALGLPITLWASWS